MNKVQQLFTKGKGNILSVYFTAGFPALEDTVPVLEHLVNAGVDMIEIGIPFSDPLADGPVIQQSSERALENGMSLKKLFGQLKDHKSKAPLLLMGYLNPVLQFGAENFCREAQACGISGVIIPDLPMQEYQEEYKTLFEKYGLVNVFLITPQTSAERIRFIDEHSNGFIYLVSSASTTGVKSGISEEQERYFARVKNMKLKNPLMIGFGISDKKGFEKACAHANGAIIGSAFIKMLNEDGVKGINAFVKGIRG
ncbi:MAG TPA: tryptophan synthase subunit alpha [Bacteroidia bacterium]|jgi:tryptophan synthase alpha chain